MTAAISLSKTREVQSFLFVWIVDLLPDEARERVEPLMDAGCAAFARNVAG